MGFIIIYLIMFLVLSYLLVFFFLARFHSETLASFWVGCTSSKHGMGGVQMGLAFLLEFFIISYLCIFFGEWLVLKKLGNRYMHVSRLA